MIVGHVLLVPPISIKRQGHSMDTVLLKETDPQVLVLMKQELFVWEMILNDLH